MSRKKQFRNTIDGIRGIVTFFTVIPLGGTHDIEKAFAMSWLSPLIVPLITGLIPGILGLIMWHLLGNSLVSSVTAYALLILLTGFNHIDGFADTADALMIKGDIDRRLRVLKDPHKGPVAIASIVLLMLIAISFLSVYPSKILYVLYIADVISKDSCCTSALIGKEPGYQGLGYIMTRNLRSKAFHVIAIDVITTFISYLLLGFLGVLTLLITVLLSMWIFNYVQRLLNGAVGDLYGFILELSRVMAIIMLVLALSLRI